ncbi:stealth conserved region 3 domain-containing protein [Galbitalea sp. SE-J8]|uniref:stealth conserved region 3 domain-containing protein n=1 Tax=Galbitalea sp. SE-J8 TaxID=3054952 RepID=UPI00259D27A5|nr:stealth conserved region 3 domain-containing protein [Galbitalea sp. SE-J8]MDM4762623.1 stealth conserved region 3 domain-containing protein [Galbitalea sp. SE-J8]
MTRGSDEDGTPTRRTGLRPVAAVPPRGRAAHPSAHRPTLVRRKGRLTLVNGSMTPAEATRADLLAVADALESAGIELLLVEGSGDRPVIAVDAAERGHVRGVLVAALGHEPFYAKARGQAAVPLADGRLAERGKPRVIRLFRPRVEPVGGLAYGAKQAVQLEFWRWDDHLVEPPVENALTRRVLPRGEVRLTTVVRHGRTWRTIAPMFRPTSDRVSFDVDMVFSWVDGTDVEFQRARAARMASYVVGEGDDHAARYRQIDELRYALRSVHLFAPWVRRVFIATDSPAPSWLAADDRVTIVRSEEFFGDRGVLPTHNSQGVESQLHRIDGLADHYLYSNDDMFFGRPVAPEMFFTPGGGTRWVPATTRIGLGAPDRTRSGFENSARVNRALIEDRYGVTITRHLEHCAAPFSKAVVRELEAEFAVDFARTAASPFRSATDISVTNSLYHYYALLTGRASINDAARVKYIDTTSRAGLAAMDRLLAKRDHDMFCLNDGSFPEVSAEERSMLVRGFLDRYFGIRAPWERADAASAPLAVGGR